MYVTSVNFLLFFGTNGKNPLQRKIKTEESTSVKFQLLGRQSLEINGYLLERL